MLDELLVEMFIKAELVLEQAREVRQIEYAQRDYVLDREASTIVVIKQRKDNKATEIELKAQARTLQQLHSTAEVLDEETNMPISARYGEFERAVEGYDEAKIVKAVKQVKKNLLIAKHALITINNNLYIEEAKIQRDFNRAEAAHEAKEFRTNLVLHGVGVAAAVPFGVVATVTTAAISTAIVVSSL